MKVRAVFDTGRDYEFVIYDSTLVNPTQEELIKEARKKAIIKFGYRSKKWFLKNIIKESGNYAKQI